MADELAIAMSNVSVESLNDSGNSYMDNKNDLMDMNETRTICDDHDDVKPILPIVQVSPMVIEVEQKKKPIERQVKHRNTGKISIANLPRRRLLSVSSESASAYFRQLRVNTFINQNRSQSVPRAPQAPFRTTTSIIVRSTSVASSSNQLESVAAAHGQVNYVAPNSARAQSPEQEQSNGQQQEQQQPRQQSQQSQQLQAIISQMNTETFCIICQQGYTTRQGLRSHQKTQKHKTNLKNMDPARRHLLALATAQARANRQ